MRVRHAALAGAITVALAAVLLAASPAAGQTLRIYQIDVDQGDATLFVSPAGHALLIDSGKNGHGPRLKAVMDAAGVAAIDYFVCTHYHEDHCGGIDDLIDDLGVTVGEAYDRGDKEYLGSTTLGSGAYSDYEAAVGNRAHHLMRGETIPLDPDMVVTCLASGGVVLGETDPTTGTDENDMSVALLIQYGGFRYFIGGDIQTATERKIAEHDLALDVDVYQADHHGSDTSSNEELMNDLVPSVIVISNGDRADYQHPRRSTLERYSNLSPAPAVFQTNRYTKGGEGGNVQVSHIADLDPSGPEGTILLTVGASGDYEVSYRDTTIAFPVKPARAMVAEVVIESVLPDPVGKDRDLEEVTLHNKGTAAADMTGWALMDDKGRVWTLTGMGTIDPGASKTIRRNGMPMNLNNGGDHVRLLDANGQMRDEYTYERVGEGVVLATGH
jgi:competence protein ComEC